MAQINDQVDTAYSLKKFVTIIFLLLTFVMPVLGIIGVVLMWIFMKWKTWVKILITLPFALVFILAPLLILNYTLFIRPVSIKGDAMSPNFTQGQYYISTVLRNSNEIKRGDVVVFSSPSNPDIEFFKRVVGLPNEKVMISNGLVHINGAPLNESAYLDPSITTQTFADGTLKEGEEITIPADSYFVLGDNRPKSSDSRQLGFISRDLLQSKMLFCYLNCK